MSGLFVLSLDTEIAWGTYGARNLEARRSSFERYREYFPQLMTLLDEYRVPTTFAIVGHLFLDHCEGHPDMPHAADRWTDDAAGASRDPCNATENSPWYFGSDIVAQIEAAAVQHEFGTHTFTHVIATHPTVTAAVWDAELERCAALHAEHGHSMQAIVYPQNQIAYLNALAAHGITTYRGSERRWYSTLSKSAQRPFHLLDRVMGFAAPTYAFDGLLEPSGLVNLPSSQFLMPYGGVRALIPTASRVRQARRGIARAAGESELYHLWFHPFNLGSGKHMFVALERILAYAAEQRERGRLRMMTMGDAAQWILDGMPKTQAQ
jgi:peptidoglycan/xylan/chitin deacetylase (PgdA/CDA1 family)